jgi:hypothetical protein
MRSPERYPQLNRKIAAPSLFAHFFRASRCNGSLLA